MRHLLLMVAAMALFACAPEYAGPELPQGPHRVYASPELSSVEARNVKEACSVLGLQFWAWQEPPDAVDGETVVLVAPADATAVTVEGRSVRFDVAGYVTVDVAIDQLEELL